MAFLNKHIFLPLRLKLHACYRRNLSFSGSKTKL